MNVSILVRGKWVELEGVKIRQDSSNAWTLTIPMDGAIARRVRRAHDLEAWDGAEFLLDDQETAPCVCTGADGRSVTVSVWT